MPLPRNCSQVLFYNQTAREDPRTGQSTYSLTMQVACGTVGECASAGDKLFNTTNQANLTRQLAQDDISVLPSTLQVRALVTCVPCV